MNKGFAYFHAYNATDSDLSVRNFNWRFYVQDVANVTCCSSHGEKRYFVAVCHPSTVFTCLDKYGGLGAQGHKLIVVDPSISCYQNTVYVHNSIQGANILKSIEK